jgi:hypothetical protein
MNVNAPISIVVAAYSDLDDAAWDFASVWSARADGDFHHTSVALLSRDHDDELQVQRSDSTAKYLHWGGALMGGPVFMFAPAVGAKLLSGSGLTGAGAIIGHIRENADPAALDAAAALLCASPTSLVVVAVNRQAADMAVLLARATMTSTVDMLWGDLEEELCQDFVRSLSETMLAAG